MNVNGYWFPRKRRGYGYGLPEVWQGWVCLVLFLAIIIGDVALLARARPQASAADIILYIAVLVLDVVALCIVAYKKGEPRS